MIHLKPCACPPAKMARIHRSAWMRLLFPSRALYQCGSCGGRFLATLAEQADLGMRAQAERLRTHDAALAESSIPKPASAT